jgi:lysophospholipase L1-like esterase
MVTERTLIRTASTCLVFLMASALSGCDGPPALPGAPPDGTVAAAPDTGAPQAGAPGAGGIRYLALGDSLTQGVGAPDMETGAFPALLAQRWRAQGCPVELKNSGVSGYTSGQVISEELPDVATFNPTVITFQAGGNDIANGVPIEEYRTNVRRVLTAAKASGARVLALAQNEWYRSPQGLNYGSDLAERRAAYDAALIEEINAAGAQFVDLRPIYRQEADANLWVEDGIHPTPEAYQVWADELARIVPAPCR